MFTPRLHISDDGLVEEVTRVKRSSFSPVRIAQKRNIELLVVADETMVEKYGTQEATTYILTVMNMVSGKVEGQSSIWIFWNGTK